MASLHAHETPFDAEFSDVSTPRRGRHRVSGGVLAEFPALELTVPVRDLSRGGFSIAAQSPFEPRPALAVRLRCATEETPLVAVRVVHTRPDARTETNVVGFQFLDANDPRLRASLTMILRTHGCLAT